MKNIKIHGIEDVIEKENPALTFIGLETSKLCPLKCIYCFENAGMPDKDELTLSERIDVLTQAKDIGAKTMVVTGAGEPLVDPLIKDIIKYANSLSLTSVIYTCGWNIDKAMAEFLYGHDVSLNLKLESLDEATHDFITGKPGSHKRAMQAIEYLLDAGYSQRASQADGSAIMRLQIATIVLKQNLVDIPRLAEWVEEKGIKLGLDELGLFGKAADNAIAIDPTKEEYETVIKSAAQESLSRKGESCKLWKYGIIISNTGGAKYCAEIPAEDACIGNIRQSTLKELLEIKNVKYAARATGCGSCILKKEARERLYRGR